MKKKHYKCCGNCDFYKKRLVSSLVNAKPKGTHVYQCTLIKELFYPDPWFYCPFHNFDGKVQDNRIAFNPFVERVQ